MKSKINFQPLNMRIQEYSRKKYRYGIDACYPQFSNTDDARLTAINDYIAEYILELVNEFRNAHTKNETMQTDQQKLQKLYEIETLSINYHCYLVKSDFISWEFVISEYYPGTPHPNFRTETFNIQGKNMKLLRLKDLFKKGCNFTKRISDYCISDLTKQSKKDRNPRVDWIKKGAGPKNNNFSKFCLDKSNLIFFFDPYTVGPYSWGRKEVIIPYTKLVGLFDEQSIIYRSTIKNTI